MAKIQVYLHGQLLSELLLKSGDEYYAGRGSQCHIILANERGISRQHIRFYQEADVWCAQLIAKFGNINFEGQNTTQVEMKKNLEFIVQPYRFQFISDLEVNKTNSVEARPESDEAEKHNPAPYDPENNEPSSEQEKNEILQVENKSPLTTKDELNESTIIAKSALIAHLRIVNNKTKLEETLKLDGVNWTIGRQLSCEVVINDASFSRKHFTIKKESDSYFVTDLDSSNGTRLNGDILKANQPTKLSSRDIISVKHIEFIFELHDHLFSQKINSLVPIGQSDDHQNYTNQLSDDISPTNDVVLRIPPENSNPFQKINKLHVIIGCLSLFLVYGLLSKSDIDETKTMDSKDISSTLTNTSAQLSPDKQKEIHDIFNLAQNYYMQRKFVLCLSQIEKLHTMTPFYQNSKELDSLCRQAQELEQIELDRKRKEDERASAENKIRKITEDCKQQINSSTTTMELSECLQTAIELDPQHGLIVELQTHVALQEAKKTEQQNRQSEYEQRKKEGLFAFQKATQLLNDGKLKQALSSYRKFVKNNYPGLQEKENEAKRNISSIENTIEQKLNEDVTQCQQSLEKAELKNAIQACDRVLAENSNHPKAKDLRKKAMSQLRKEMKLLYDDAILEESLGNVEAAKEKWLRIKELSFRGEDYYLKATKKLSKHGLTD